MGLNSQFSSCRSIWRILFRHFDNVGRSAKIYSEALKVKGITEIFLSCSHHCSRRNTLQWRHAERDGVSNYQPYDCFLNRLFRRRSKKTSKLRVTGLCEGNSPVTGEFLAQRPSNVENVSIWWRDHYVTFCYFDICRHKAELLVYTKGISWMHKTHSW